MVVHGGSRRRPSSSSSRRDDDDENNAGAVPRPPAAWFELEKSMAEAAVEAVEKVRRFRLQEVLEEEEEEDKEVARQKGTGRLSAKDNGGSGGVFDEQNHAAAAAAARRVLFSWLDQEELLPSPEFPVEEAPPPPPSASAAAAAAAAVAVAATSSTSSPPPPLPPLSFCSLAPAPAGRRFARRDLRAYLSGLFGSIPAARRRDGLPPVALSRFDLFHVHFFLAGLEPLLLPVEEEEEREDKNEKDRRRKKKNKNFISTLGLLFHAAEYPAPGPVEFPHALGWCQRGSDLRWSERAAEWRTLVAARGGLASVRLSSAAAAASSEEGAKKRAAAAVVADALVWPELREVHTLLESDLGIWLGDGVLCVDGGGGGREESGREKQESEGLRDVLVYVPGLMF